MFHQTLRACALALVTLLPINATPTHAAEPKYYRAGKDVAAVPYASWESGGHVKTAVGEAEVAKAPKNAVKYTVKTVNWPTGAIRVFTFTKAGGGVLHTLTDESHFFVLKGSLKVNVNGKQTLLKWEDLGASLSGVIRSGDKVEDTTIVAWIGGPVSTATPVPTVVRAADVTPGVGPRGVLDTPDPKKSQKSISVRYEFPGNSVRYVRMFPDGISAPHTGPLDNFIYLVEGHVQYQQGGETYEVYGGDFFIQESGTVHEWDRKEGAIFVTSSVLPEGVKTPMDQDKIN